MFSAISNWLGSRESESIEEVEEESEEEGDEEGIELITMKASVDAEYTENIQEEFVKITWSDDTQDTTRWCDSLEKDGGEYLLKSIKSSTVETYRSVRFKHTYNVDLRIPSESVKAIDVTEREQRQVSDTHRTIKSVTMPVDEVGDYETFEFTNHKYILMDSDVVEEYNEEYAE